MAAKITLGTVPSLEQAEGLRRARRVIDQNFQQIKDAIQRQSQDNSLIAPSLLLHGSLAALDADDHLQAFGFSHRSKSLDYLLDEGRHVEFARC